METKRNTEQKRIIMSVLKTADHPTASELYEIIHERYPRLSRATVFRVLGQFADEGSVRRLSLKGSDTRFDAGLVPHAHCHCVKCGKITDVFEGDFKSVLNTRSAGGYIVYSTEIEFNGLCPDCVAGEKLN